MTLNLSRMAQDVLAAAKAAGADAADVLMVESASLSIEALNGSLEHAERSESTDIGLRVLLGARQATISTADVSADAITAMAERCVAMARVAPEDPTAGLADKGDLSEVRDRLLGSEGRKEEPEA